MIIRMMRVACRPLALAAFGLALTVLVALPNPASARVWIGFGFPLFVGPPAYYYPPPPYYYPPPAYYPPPPGYYGAPPYSGYAPPPPGYAQPGAQYTPSNQSCTAGGSVCPMERPVASGSSCYCTTGQGRVWGRAT